MVVRKTGTIAAAPPGGPRMLRTEMTGHRQTPNDGPGPFGPYPEPLPGWLSVALPPAADLTAFCRRWKIKDLAIFGAAVQLGGDPSAPVEAMVGFWRAGQWVLDDFARLQGEICGLFGREVNLIERATVDVSNNPVLRQRIFRSVRTIYLER